MAVTPAGQRDKRIGFERATTGQDGAGQETEAWATLGDSQWAAVFWGRGDERRQAAAEQGTQAATFRVLDNTLTRSIVIKDRIAFEGVWDIQGIATPKRGEIEFSATRSS